MRETTPGVTAETRLYANSNSFRQDHIGRVPVPRLPVLVAPARFEPKGRNADRADADLHCGLKRPETLCLWCNNCAASIVSLAQLTNRSALCTASLASLAVACLDSYSTTFFLARSILSCLACEAMGFDCPPISWSRVSCVRGATRPRPSPAGHPAATWPRSPCRSSSGRPRERRSSIDRDSRRRFLCPSAARAAGA